MSSGKDLGSVVDRHRGVFSMGEAWWKGSRRMQGVERKEEAADADDSNTTLFIHHQNE